jgi:hypothetical protein
MEAGTGPDDVDAVRAELLALATWLELDEVEVESPPRWGRRRHPL